MIGVGQQLGSYMVLQRIGRGGMGEVYLAQHKRVARRAAIKVLVPELSQNATVLDRFFNEARATSLIRHPGIVEILDCDVFDGQAFIIMELLEGESLGGYLQRAGALGTDLPFLLGAATAVASAVGAAHATGIIHRDLKPDNVYLHLPGVSDPTVAVKILDFGIAKLAQQDGGPSQTSTGVLLGTPAYMSPEQCRGAGKVDGRSDVYSFGCILYEAICGSPVFVREGVGDLIIAHVAEEPQPLASRVNGLPASLNTLVLRMLAKKAEQRPQSMEEVAGSLRDCARGLGISVETPLRPRSPVQRPIITVEGAPTFPSRAASSGSGASAVRPPSGGGPTPRPNIPTPAPMTPLGGAPTALPRDGGGMGMGVGSGPVGAVGGTRVLATQKPTTLGAAAGAVEAKVSARKPPWLAIAAGAVVVLGGAAVLIATLTRPEPSVSATRRTSRPTTSGDDGEPARPPRRPAAPAPGAGEDSPTPPPTAPTAPAAPEMVRIDIQGAPPGSAVLVDDRASELPVRLPRGSGNHRITLTPPGGKPRIIDVDGTRDRVIELTLEKPGARPPVAESPPPRPPRPTGGTKPAGGGTKPAGGGTKPAGGGTKPPTAAGGHQKPPDKDKKTEREAIIDI